MHLLNQPSQLRLIEYVCWLECPCHVEAATDPGRGRELSLDVDHDGPVPSWRRPFQVVDQVAGGSASVFGLITGGRYLVRIGRSPLEM